MLGEIVRIQKILLEGKFWKFCSKLLQTFDTFKNRYGKSAGMISRILKHARAICPPWHTVRCGGLRDGNMIKTVQKNHLGKIPPPQTSISGSFSGFQISWRNPEIEVWGGGILPRWFFWTVLIMFPSHKPPHRSRTSISSSCVMQSRDWACSALRKIFCAGSNHGLEWSTTQQTATWEKVEIEYEWINTTNRVQIEVSGPLESSH